MMKLLLFINCLIIKYRFSGFFLFNQAQPSNNADSERCLYIFDGSIFFEVYDIFEVK